MTAPIGAIVGLYVDLFAPVGTGDIIQTEAGRRYRALSVRLQKRGMHVGRQHLRCIVVDEDAEPDEMVYAGPEGITRAGIVHTIRWYKRTSKKKGRRAA